MASIKSFLLFSTVACAAQLPEIKDRSPSELVKLSFSLHPESPDLLERTLHEISDPLHPRYGKHLTRDEAKALLAPRDDSTDAVKRWLEEAGVPAEHIKRDGARVHVNVPREKAEILARAANEPLDETVKRSENDVRNHIVWAHRSVESVAGNPARQKRSLGSFLTGDSILEQRTSQKGKVDLKKCDRAWTAPCLRKLYGIPEKKVKPAKNSVFGIGGFFEQSAQYEQLENYQDKYDPFSTGANFTWVGVNGGDNPQEVLPDEQYASGEANLNTQLGVSLAYNVPVRYFATGGFEENWTPDLDYTAEMFPGTVPWMEFAQYLLDLPDKDLPHVMSLSWGNHEQHLPAAYERRVCDMFGQLGTRGMSVIVAAGNEGPGMSCQSNDGKKTAKFTPLFPAACPYVTSVGGTETPDEAWQDDFVGAGSSAGGFSELFKQPEWQKKAVEKYLKKLGKKNEKYYNKGGRAWPDVAAMSDGIPIFNHGNEVPNAGGTSAAAPIFAAIIALINNERLENKKPPLGFLNPFLYQNDDAFNDITRGSSRGCEGVTYTGEPSPVTIPNAGWEAVKGWDPVTGLGTVKFDKLLKAAMKRK